MDKHNPPAQTTKTKQWRFSCQSNVLWSSKYFLNIYMDKLTRLYAENNLITVNTITKIYLRVHALSLYMMYVGRLSTPKLK